MKFFWTVAIAAALIASCSAFAQQANPAQEQIERTIGSLVVANASLLVQVGQAKAEIADLQKQLAAEKAKHEPPKPQQ